MKPLNSFYSFLLRNRSLFTIIAILLIAIVFVNTDLYARMGGAGGSSSSSDSSDGAIGILIYLFMLLPFPINIIVIAIVIILGLILNKKGKQKSILNAVSVSKKEDIKGIEELQLIHPEFNKEEFIKKVSVAFTEIQNAWSAKDIAKVRRFISDGMYQRVNTQFKMMDLLMQKNILEKIQIHNISIAKVSNEQLFTCIDVCVVATIKDQFISEKYPKLNSSSSEQFVEYWSFIRKASMKVINADLYSSYNCPNCGGNLLSNMGDMCQCPYCKTITNSGDYDWVLSEITQANDYVANTKVQKYSQELSGKLSEIQNVEEEFSTQIIEDKASNGYLQIQTALVYKDAKLIKKFVTDEYYNSIEAQINKQEQFVYNRIYLNNVDLISASITEKLYKVYVSINVTTQKVAINNKTIELIDPTMVTKNYVIVMVKDKEASENKGSVYAHQCPNCGGALESTSDINCPYCNSQVNSSQYDWIISNIMEYSTFSNYMSNNRQEFFTELKTQKVDSLYKVRDYAFNNVLVMVAADNYFTDEEIEFVNKLAKRLGYSVDKIQGMIDLAKDHKLAIQMPKDAKDREKVYKLMVKAASIDGNIAPEEKSLLDNIRKEYFE